MKTTVREQLTEALESAEYLQGRGALSYLDVDGRPHFCPLGLLCHLYERKTGGKRGKFLYYPIIPDLLPELEDDAYHLQAIGATGIGSFLYQYIWPPRRVAVWAGLTLEEERQLRLWADEEGLSFREIARRLRGNI